MDKFKRTARKEAEALKQQAWDTTLADLGRRAAAAPGVVLTQKQRTFVKAAQDAADAKLREQLENGEEIEF